MAVAERVDRSRLGGSTGLSLQPAASRGSLELVAGTPPFRSLRPGPCASIPFYEVISVLSIGRRLLSTSAGLVLARKQVSTADLSEAKIIFLNFFLPFYHSFPSDFFAH